MAPRHWRHRRSYRTCLTKSWGLKNRPTNRNSTFFKRPVYSLNVNSSGPSGMQPEAAVAPEPGTPRAPSTPGCHVPLHGKGRPRSFFMMESGFVHCCFEKWVFPTLENSWAVSYRTKHPVPYDPATSPCGFDPREGGLKVAQRPSYDCSRSRIRNSQKWEASSSG